MALPGVALKRLPTVSSVTARTIKWTSPESPAHILGASRRSPGAYQETETSSPPTSVSPRTVNKVVSFPETFQEASYATRRVDGESADPRRSRGFSNRGAEIRTRDLLTPSQAR